MPAEKVLLLYGAAALILASANPPLAAQNKDGQPARIAQTLPLNETIDIPAPESGQPQPDIVIRLYDNEGMGVGSAGLTEGTEGVIVQLDLMNMPPGGRAFHIHERGDCTPLDSFANAGDHLNPEGVPHGFMESGGPHPGDMPNIFIAVDGTAQVEIFNPYVTLNPAAGDDRVYLLDNDGTALVIHAGLDDHSSQPSGNAGDRIACGAIVRQE